MRRVLKKRPWGNPEDPTAGGKEAAASDVLEVLALVLVVTQALGRQQQVRRSGVMGLYVCGS